MAPVDDHVRVARAAQTVRYVLVSERHAARSRLLTMGLSYPLFKCHRRVDVRQMRVLPDVDAALVDAPIDDGLGWAKSRICHSASVWAADLPYITV